MNGYTPPMRVLTRYLLRQLTVPFLMITLTLTGVVWLSQSLRFLDKLMSGMSAGTVALITLLIVPGVLTIILPFALFCALLAGYHKLALDSELVVMRAAGLSRRQLARPGLLLGLGVALLSYGLTLFLMPYGLRNVREMNTEWRSSFASALIQEGVFNAVRNGLTVYIRERGSDGTFRGILVHDSRNPDRPVTYMAESGRLTFTEKGPQFAMVKGNRQEIDRNGNGLNLLYFDSYVMDLSSFTEGGGKRWRKPSERYLSELLWPEDTDEARRNAWALLVEANRRLMIPLYAFALAAIAIASVLTGEFNRKTQISRIGATGLIGFAVMASGFGLIQAAIKLPWLLNLVYLHLALSIAVPLFILYRSHRRRPIPAAAVNEGEAA